MICWVDCWRACFATLCTVAILTEGVGVHAAIPVLDHLYPAGGAVGSTNSIQLFGKFDPWPPKVWIGTGGITCVAETNKGTLRLEISTNAVPGAALIRLHNEEGASEPRFFVVGKGREVSEVETNNSYSSAQRLSGWPLTVNGRLNRNGDVDGFAISMEAGEWLDARLDAYILMSKLDGVLRLVSTNGVQITWNHDWATLDPRIVWQSPQKQTVVLQVMGFAYPADSDVRLSGGEGAVYRLHLNVGGEPPCDAYQELSEKEPNDSPKHAAPIQLGKAVAGSIQNAGDEDRFSLVVEKDQTIEASVEAAALGSPLDAVLRIEDEAGKQISRNDDAEGTRDPRLEWKTTKSGPVVVAVGSLTRRGGSNHVYRLSARLLNPGYEATVAASSFVATVGQTNEIKVNAKG